MKEVDYSKLGKLTLEETNLLSLKNSELIEFIYNNEITKVSEFLKCMDNKSYQISTYNDVLLEANGLVNLIKYKYFKLPLVNDIYLGKKIEKMKFKKNATGFESYAINLSDNRINKPKSIYTVLTELGFNSWEREIILDITMNELDGMLLVDLLNNTYSRVIINNKIDRDYEVLCNKILLILEYYLTISKSDIESNFMKSLYDAIDYLNDLLAQKYRLERQINDVQNKIKNGKISEIGGRK